MSYLSLEFETKDLYPLKEGDEPTSRLLDVEFDAFLRKGEVVCVIETLWCVDSKKFITDAAYKLTDRDMAAIHDAMMIHARENFGAILGDDRDATEGFFHSVFGED